MNIKTINDLLSYVETEEKAQRLINYINSLENYVKMKEIDVREFSKENYYNKLEIERLNNVINELEKYLIEYFKKEYPDRKLEDYNLENCTYDYALVILGKLQELKGEDKE